MKKEDQCRSILPQANRQELPYEVDFRRKSSPLQKGFLENVTCLGNALGDFQREVGECGSILAWNRDGKL